MRTVCTVAILFLSGCGAGQTLPLAHTSPSDPIWAINPDKWQPGGGNNLTTVPTVPSGRIPTAAVTNG